MLTLSPNLKEVVRGGNENETHFPSISSEISVLISYLHIYLYACIFTHIDILYLQQLDIAGYHETMIILAAGAKFTGTLTMAQAPSAVFADLRSSSRPQKWCITSSMQKKTIIFGPMKKEDDFTILGIICITV